MTRGLMLCALMYGSISGLCSLEEQRVLNANEYGLLVQSKMLSSPMAQDVWFSHQVTHVQNMFVTVAQNILPDTCKRHENPLVTECLQFVIVSTMYDLFLHYVSSSPYQWPKLLDLLRSRTMFEKSLDLLPTPFAFQDILKTQETFEHWCCAQPSAWLPRTRQYSWLIWHMGSLSTVINRVLRQHDHIQVLLSDHIHDPLDMLKTKKTYIIPLAPLSSTRPEPDSLIHSKTRLPEHHFEGFSGYILAGLHQALLFANAVASAPTKESIYPDICCHECCSQGVWAHLHHTPWKKTIKRTNNDLFCQHFSLPTTNTMFLNDDHMKKFLQHLIQKSGPYINALGKECLRFLYALLRQNTPTFHRFYAFTTEKNIFAFEKIDHKLWFIFFPVHPFIDEAMALQGLHVVCSILLQTP